MTLSQKVLNRIEASHRITDHYRPGGHNTCGLTHYKIDDRLTVVYLHNGCDSVRILVDGIEANIIDRDTVMSAIEDRKEKIKRALIESL